MTSYDAWLAQEADKYNTPCEPTQIEPDSEHHSGDYNCHHCDATSCEHWLDYNDIQNNESEAA